jgi:hypothetical protein
MASLFSCRFLLFVEGVACVVCVGERETCQHVRLFCGEAVGTKLRTIGPRLHNCT